MAFPQAPGNQNLPNGNFSPVIYSKKAQIAFRKKAVVKAITNTEYQGEISDYGDSVKIIKEPEIAISSYARGGSVPLTPLDDEEIVMLVDKANAFRFQVDDIEKKHAHHNWSSLASDRAAYKLADEMDREVLEYITTQVNTASPDHLIGSTSTPAFVDVTSGSADFTPLGILNRMKRLLDEQDVPAENRWFVGDPVFFEKLNDENSKLLDNDYASGNILRNGMVAEGVVRGFQLFQSNNLLQAGNGPAGTADTDYGWILAGHTSAVSTAENLVKTEQYRPDDSFADGVKGLHVYGRKVLRKEALIGAVYNSG